MKYAPVPPLKVGDTVVFVNKDIFRHTVTATNNSFNLDLMPGKSGSLHINSAGTRPSTASITRACAGVWMAK